MRRYRDGALVRVRLLWDGNGEAPKGRWCTKLGTVLRYDLEVGHSQTPAYLVLVDGFTQLFRPDSLNAVGPQEVDVE